MPNNTCSMPSCEANAYVRGYCRPHYARFMKYGDPLGAPAKKPHKNCDVSGCEQPARSKSAALCPMHYHRQYRHGSVDAKYNTFRSAPECSYQSAYAPAHPLASKQGKVYVHRQVLFDSIGPGAHACHWCATTVEWSAALWSESYLQVDHVDEDKANNELSNLVPSCGPCNTARSMLKRNAIARDMGAWSANDTISRTGKGRSMRFADA